MPLPGSSERRAVEEELARNAPFFCSFSLARLRSSGLTEALFHCRGFGCVCCVVRELGDVYDFLEYGVSSFRGLSFGEPARAPGEVDRGGASNNKSPLRRALE